MNYLVNMLDFLFRKKKNIKGSENALMIIDMQDEFLPYLHYKNTRHYMEIRKRLILNILDRIYVHKYEGNDIIFVEYKGANPTIWSIEEPLVRYPYEILKKNVDGLLRSSGKLRARALYALEPLKNSQIELVGVNASACVRQTASSMIDEGFNVKVPLNCTLNVKYSLEDKEKFKQDNRIGQIIKYYSEDQPCPDSLWFERDISHLLDMTGFDEEKHEYIWEI